MMGFVCYKYHSYFVCLARDAFARLETLVPSIVHQRTANIFTDYDPYYRSWYQTDFNKTHAQYKGILL